MLRESRKIQAIETKNCVDKPLSSAFFSGQLLMPCRQRARLDSRRAQGGGGECEGFGALRDGYKANRSVALVMTA